MLNQPTKKKIITVLLLVSLILVYVMIFRFSADDAQESSALSRTITDFVMQIYEKLTDADGAVVTTDTETLPLEKIIRKAAHFAEYMAVGFLSFGIAALWMKRLWGGALIVIVQLLISGTLDELHQYFVPGRYASVKDVMIDTIGGIVGIILLSVIMAIKGKNKQLLR